MSSNRAVGFVLGAVLAIAAVLGAPAFAAEDLSQLEVTPLRDQSADQARRDRFECHNWAVAQTGETPVAVPARERDAPSREQRQKRGERINRVVNGAAIGAGLGGLVRATQDKNPSNGVLAGAAVGAAVGAATGRERDRKDGREADTAPSDYLRALSACMEGRGYTVALPGVGEAVAQR